MNNKEQTAVEWLVEELLNGKALMPSIIEEAKEMEEKQKGYTLEQMMDCWNAALKFEPHGPNFIDYITSIKKGNKKADE
jgi:hypothetical protein